MKERKKEIENTRRRLERLVLSEQDRQLAELYLLELLAGALKK